MIIKYSYCANEFGSVISRKSIDINCNPVNSSKALTIIQVLTLVGGLSETAERLSRSVADAGLFARDLVGDDPTEEKSTLL